MHPGRHLRTRWRQSVGTASDADTVPLVRAGPARPFADQEGPVFVDSSGRRARTVRRLTYGLGVPCAVYTVVLVLSFMGATPFAPRSVLPVPGVPSQAPGDVRENTPRDPSDTPPSEVPVSPSDVPVLPAPSPSVSGSASSSTGGPSATPSGTASPTTTGPGATSSTSTSGPVPSGTSGTSPAESGSPSTTPPISASDATGPSTGEPLTAPSGETGTAPPDGSGVSSGGSSSAGPG